MKTSLMALLFLPMAVLGAQAQDVAWSELAQGDRVEITFPSGATLRGTLVAASPRTTRLEVDKETALTLDLTWEYPGLNGTLTVPKKDVKSVRRLQALDQKTLQELERMKKQLAAENAKAAAEARPAPPPAAAAPKPEPLPGDPPAPKKEDEDLKKAIEFYNKFAPPFWGPEHHIVDIQKVARGQALSPAESEFEAGYPVLWEKGRAASAPRNP